jgi:hypothetical protein
MKTLEPSALRHTTDGSERFARRNPFVINIFLLILLVTIILSGCVSSVSLATAPSNVSFGNVAIGSSSKKKISVTNSGTGTFTITETTLSGRGFSIQGPPLPMMVAAGQTATFTTIFAPTAVGDTSGSVSITRIQSSLTELTAEGMSAPPSSTTQQTTIALNGAGVLTDPSVTTQPGNQTVIAGQTATFSVAASGAAPLSYQWRRNGMDISGATASAFTTPVAQSADSGAQFTVAVSNSTGTVTSSAAALTVNAAGQLTASTTSLSYGNITVGSSSVLSVTLTNTGVSSISISNVALSGTGVSVSGVPSGLILAAGSSAALNVTFAPFVSGNMKGTVNITSSATNATVTISLLGTAVQPGSHFVTLNFSGNSPSVAGFNVYRSSVSGGPYTKLNSSQDTVATYTDSSILGNHTYFYIGTSVDSLGKESAHSNEVSVMIPAP